MTLNYNRDYSNGANGISNGIKPSRITKDYLRIKPFKRLDIKLGWAYTGLLAFDTIVDTNSKPVFIDEY